MIVHTHRQTSKDVAADYKPQFVPKDGLALISNCLAACQMEPPDFRVLLQSTAAMSVLFKQAQYDHVVMRNLEIENQLLVQDRDILQLNNIKDKVSYVSNQLSVLERLSRNLETDIKCLSAIGRKDAETGRSEGIQKVETSRSNHDVVTLSFGTVT